MGNRYLTKGLAYGLLEVQRFTGDGFTSEFSLVYRVPSPAGILVHEDTVFQRASIDYSLDNGGTTLVFSTPPLVGADIEVRYLNTQLTAPSTLNTSAFVFNETPSGTINGINNIYSVVFDIVPGTLQLYKNGSRMRDGISNDYTVTGSAQFTLTIPPQLGDDLYCDYIRVI